jgi:predicted nucleic-acid-binding Zn-ribbon protein
MKKHWTARCPKCGSDDLRPRGISGSRGNAGDSTFGIAGKFIGQMFDTAGYDPAKHEEIEYSCNKCKNHFFVKRKADHSAKDFEEPFTITFYREKKFVGAVTPHIVFLNGDRIGDVKNGQSIQFSTYKIKNVLVVTSVSGDAFPDFLPFIATEGGSMNVRFAFKFMDE